MYMTLPTAGNITRLRSERPDWPGCKQKMFPNVLLNRVVVPSHLLSSMVACCKTESVTAILFGVTTSNFQTNTNSQ